MKIILTLFCILLTFSCTTISSNTDIFSAIEEKDYPLLKKISESSLNINSKNSLGETALVLAVKNNDSASVQILLENNADPNIGNIENIDLLQWSLSKNQYETSVLLIKSIDNINKYGLNGLNYLHVASLFSSLNLVNDLINNGADPNLIAYNNYTPIMLSEISLVDRENKIKYYLDLNVDVDHRDDRGLFLLFNYLITEMFKENDKKKSQTKPKLIDAETYAPLLYEILEKTNNVELPTGRSLIEYLSVGVNNKVINLYLRKFPNETFYGEVGYNILSHCLIRGYKEEFKLLLPRVNDIEFKNDKNFHIFYYSLLDKERFWAAEILLEYGYDIQLRGYNNYSPLSALVYDGFYKKALWLLDNGYNIDNINEKTGLRDIDDALSNFENACSNDYKNFLNELDKRNISYLDIYKKATLINEANIDDQLPFSIVKYFNFKDAFFKYDYTTDITTVLDDPEGKYKIFKKDSIYFGNNFTIAFDVKVIESLFSITIFNKRNKSSTLEFKDNKAYMYKDNNDKLNNLTIKKNVFYNVKYEYENGTITTYIDGLKIASRELVYEDINMRLFIGADCKVEIKNFNIINNPI